MRKHSLTYILYLYLWHKPQEVSPLEMLILCTTTSSPFDGFESECHLPRSLNSRSTDSLLDFSNHHHTDGPILALNPPLWVCSVSYKDLIGHWKSWLALLEAAHLQHGQTSISRVMLMGYQLFFLGFRCDGLWDTIRAEVSERSHPQIAFTFLLIPRWTFFWF